MNKNVLLAELSDEDLKAELEARELQRKRQNAAIMKNGERIEALKRVLTREILDAIIPEHDLTSCDDSKIVNGVGLWGEWRVDSKLAGPRCQRCALLELIDGDFEPDPNITTFRARIDFEDFTG